MYDSKILNNLNSKIEAKIKAKIVLNHDLFFFKSWLNSQLKPCNFTKEYFSPVNKSEVFFCKRANQKRWKTEIAVALFQSNFYLPHGFRMCYIGMLSI